MQYPSLKQGGTRQLPDGYLHLNNFSHSVKSGMAGVIFERVLTAPQQSTFEEILMHLAGSIADQAKLPITMYFKKTSKGVVRFNKKFLIAHFKRTFYGYMNLVRKQGASLLAVAATNELLDLYADGQGIPTVRFK